MLESTNTEESAPNKQPPSLENKITNDTAAVEDSASTTNNNTNANNAAEVDKMVSDVESSSGSTAPVTHVNVSGSP